MIWKTGTTQEFIHYVKNKNWHLYGAGKRLKEVQELGKKQKPIYIIDNNVSKCNKKLKFMDKEIEVIDQKEFLSICRRGDVLLLDMYDFVELFYQLESKEKLNDIECFLLDAMHLEDTYMHNFSKRMSLDSLNRFGEEKIPRKIHYCWFGGGELPKDSKLYIEGWRKLCPDYEIIRWDESNYDVHKNYYMSCAYKAKKWAFVSDYARLDVINTYGGIYLDVDVELVKPLDLLLKEDAFCGFENDKYVSFGLGFGACTHNSVIERLLSLYDSLEWDNGKVACPVYQTEVLQLFGMECNNSFQRLDDITVLPTSVLCGANSILNRKNIVSETISIHHYHGSWYEYSEREIFLKNWFSKAEKIDWRSISEI